MTVASKSSVPRPAEVEWYYVREGVQVGPVSEQGLLEAARQTEIKPDTLVWQKAYDRWKPAASVPMLAVSMGYHTRPLRTIQTPVPRRPEPTREAFQSPSTSTATEPLPESVADESLAPQDLEDAVTDDEAADPVIDVEQARVILERASLPPSADRSIPPASYASISTSARNQARDFIGATRLIGLAGAVLLVGTVAVLLTFRQSSRQDDENRTLVATVTSQAKAPRAEAPRAEPPRVEPRQAGTSQSALLAAVAPSAEPSVPPDRAPAGASERRPELVSITSGALDGQLVLHKLQRALPMFDEQCWDRLRVPVGEVAKNPSVSIDMSVDRLGNAYDFASSRAPKGYRGVGPCIIGRIRGWKFPRAEQGSHVVMTVARVRD